MSKCKVAVVDYDLGNVRSLCHALSYIGADVELTADRDKILSADAVVLPGVGAFRHGMQQLIAYGLPETLKQVVAQEIPFLGICLGMQLLFDKSDEFGQTDGLGIISGSVKLLSESDSIKLPHVGWSSVTRPTSCDSWAGSVLQGVESGDECYFVHSFVAQPDSDEHLLSTSEYCGDVFCSSVQKGSVFGCQFHPEKSSDTGLGILKSFVFIATNR